jgi:hypothetical protein
MYQPFSEKLNLKKPGVLAIQRKAYFEKSQVYHPLIEKLTLKKPGVSAIQ